MPYSYLPVDCSSLCYSRAFTMQGLRTAEVETGVIFGFLSDILLLSERFKTNKFVFCWDSKGSKRKEIFPEYKEKRGKKKEDPKMMKIFMAIFTQMAKLQYEILPSIGFSNNFSYNGFEADDIIADIVMGYDNCLMVTRDEDMYQLLDLADLWNPKQEELWTGAKFTKTYGIKPKDWIQVKAVGGCTSDEVPGIQGVGEVTAIKYITKNLKTSTKAYQEIKKGTEIIKRNLKLVSLPFKGTPESTIIKDSFSILEFEKVCNEYWLDSFLSKVGISRWENLFARRLQ